MAALAAILAQTSTSVHVQRDIRDGIVKLLNMLASPILAIMVEVAWRPLGDLSVTALQGGLDPHAPST